MELVSPAPQPEYDDADGRVVDNFDDSEGDLLAAFVDGELRGVTECVYFPFGDTYIYIMQVYSNELIGEELTFELYNIETGEIHKYTESIIFDNDMIISFLH